MIDRPKHHLAVMATKVRQLVVRVEVKNGNDVSIHCRKHTPSVAKLNLAALLDRNFVACPHVVHQEIHQAELVGEAHDQMQSGRMHCKAKRLLLETFPKIQSLLHNVPHAYSAVHSAGGDKGLPDAGIQPRDATGVEAGSVKQRYNRLDIAILHVLADNLYLE